MSIFEENGLIFIPAGHKTAKLHSVRPINGDGDLAFVNDSPVRTMINYAGMLAMVSAAQPRLELINGKPSLLMEPARTNICTNPTKIVGNSGYYIFQAIKAIFDKTTAGVEIISNGGFDSSTGWNLINSVQINGGVASFDGSADYSSVSQVLSVNPNGNTYLVKFTISNYAQGTLHVVIGGVAVSEDYDYDGEFELQLNVSGGTDNVISFESYDYFAGDIDNVSIKRIEGYLDPFGNAAGVKIIENTATTAHDLKISPVSVTQNGIYTLSAFLKKGERSIVFVRTSVGDTSYFNLDTGTCVLKAANHTSVKCEFIGGYWRCSVTFMAASSSLNLLQFGMALASGSLSYHGDGVSGLYIYGIQFERSEYPTSFIFDGSNGQVMNRAADSLSLANIQSKGFVNSQSWSLYLDIASFDSPLVGSAIINLKHDASIHFSVALTLNHGMTLYDSQNVVYPWGTISIAAGFKLCVTYDGTVKLFINGVKNAVDYHPVLAFNQIDNLEWRGDVKHHANVLILNPRCFSETEAIELTG
jgi:hypothetical protein